LQPIPPTRKERRRGSRSLGEQTSPIGCLRAYVARLFDDYAWRFDKHLIKNLGYRAPALITEALSAVAPSRRFASALDLGCGTGFMGEALRGRVDHLVGVDLSAAMIAKARERGVYDRLVVDDALAMFEREPQASFDLIAAADALVYIGDLAPLFAAVARALAADGLFAFSYQRLRCLTHMAELIQVGAGGFAPCLQR
jgi:predicted TPR repeat methyltransferase